MSHLPKRMWVLESLSLSPGVCGTPCSRTSSTHSPLPPIQTAENLRLEMGRWSISQYNLKRTRCCFFFAFMFGRLVQRMSPIFGKCCPYVASHSGHDMRLLALFFPHFERVFARPRQGNLTDTQNRKLSVSTTNTATVFRGLMNGRWQIKWKLDKILFMYFCLRSDDKLFEAEK